MFPSPAKVGEVLQGRRCDDGNRESQGPLSNAHTPAASTHDENAALRLGRTLIVKGDITAAEDLLIRGRVIGSIHVDGHVLTVGRGGNVTAEIVAPKMVVQGYVAGNVELHEQLVIAPGGMVVGEVKTPSMNIQDGGTLRQIADEAGTSSGDEPAQAPSADHLGRRLTKDRPAQDPQIEANPRERAAEHDRISPVAA